MHIIPKYWLYWYHLLVTIHPWLALFSATCTSLTQCSVPCFPCAHWTAKTKTNMAAVARYLASRGLRILASPGDGHCLLHSMVSSMNSQSSSSTGVNLDTVKSKVFLETVTNAENYFIKIMLLYLLTLSPNVMPLFRAILAPVCPTGVTPTLRGTFWTPGHQTQPPFWDTCARPCSRAFYGARRPHPL